MVINKKKKTCLLCKQKLPRDNFYLLPIKGKDWDCRDSYCIKCRVVYSYDRRKNVKRQAVEYLGHKCTDCNLVDDCYDIYDFHHVDSTLKDFSISQTNRSFESIKSEIDKCVLLCANCHRKRHAKKSFETVGAVRA